MSAYDLDRQVQREIEARVWRISPAQAELEAEWEHSACCAEAHCVSKPDPVERPALDPDEWWPESCEG